MPPTSSDNCVKHNVVINNIFAIFLQVILTFIFLTVFFFTYVNGVEKDAFNYQMDIVVDDLMEDLDIKSFIPPGQESDVSEIIMYGTLDKMKENIIKTSQSSNDKIADVNKIIRNKSTSLLSIGIASIVFVAAVLLVLNYCIPFNTIFRDTIIMVIFVAITELVFLLVITRKYKSVDPGNVRKYIGESITAWLSHHDL